MPRIIPNSDQGRRELARKDRRLRQIGKGTVLGLSAITAALLVYTLAQGI
ncbi:hypothetical protein [Alteriqipengyuania sp. 357]